MKSFSSICVAFLILLNAAPSFSQPDSSWLISQAYLTEDIVNGQINYAKLLASHNSMAQLELTYDQRLELRSLAYEFFSLRKKKF